MATCESDHGPGLPGRRVTEPVRDLLAAGAGGVVQSHCENDWSGPIAAFEDAIRARVRAHRCTSASLGRAGPVRCALFETRADDGACEGSARIDRGVVGSRRVCEVCQLGETQADAFGLDVSSCSGEEGWSHAGSVDECGDAARIDFTAGAGPRRDVTAYLDCLWPAE